MSPKKAAYENPLMPNARLRQIYRAILRAQLLGQALPPTQRSLTATREAALVSTAIDLAARDLVLDAFSSPALDFLRGTPLHRALKPQSKSSSRITADAGSPSRLPSPSDPAARIHAALGAAASLQSAAALARKTAEKSAPDSAVVLAIFIPGEVPADIWKSALTHAAQLDLPIILAVLSPESGAKPSRSAKGAPDAAALRAIAHKAGVPAIPVDAADPVALYRVAQESIGHARIGGGPALIQCVAFPAPASRTPAAIAHIEDYILSRGIATRAWMDREASSFSAQILASKSASK
jgi:TPP-dependent pyruvate/acetoin dehydrogenase alpha subunit